MKYKHLNLGYKNNKNLIIFFFTLKNAMHAHSTNKNGIVLFLPNVSLDRH
jgi:hypothetical protein